MTTAINTLEGGTNTTAISTGNSGGLSGTAFSFASGALYSTTRAAHGTLSARLPAGGSVGMGHNLTGSGTRWLRFYLWSTSWSSNPNLTYFNLGSGSYFFVSLTATQAQLRHNNGTSDSTLATVSFAPAVSAWIRVEVQLTSANPGACEIRLYNTADSSTPSGTATGSRAQTATTWSDYSLVNDGAVDVYADDVGWSDEDWMGPAVPSLLPRSIIGSSVAVHHAAIW